MTDKIIVLCPSRFRPDGLKRAVDSWERNSVASRIIFYFQEDDPALKRNIEIAGNHPYLIGGAIGLAAKVNTLCEFVGHHFAGYMVLNDDQVIQTPGWDRMLLSFIDGWEAEHGNRLVIPFWRDGIQDGRLPQGFATDELLKITGSFFPIGYMRHLFVDNTYQHIGQECGILRYLPEIFIEHLHFSIGRAAFDGNYAETNNADAWKRDEAAFYRWIAEKAHAITAHIKERISN